MGEDLKRLSVTASNLKTILLQSKNIDILLYLAKYNPDITTDEIQKMFGKSSIKGLKNLLGSHLISEENGSLHLTEDGIFQVEGLMTLAV
ncbi:MAG: hypothetical protein ISS93_03435 [Candidatus Aenigmarchaeota archaeon]|nr:hypothetical protein [Candidatus Aenigmarchaeota archaeon]